MNITFLIGNGFDLNLGLKTRYTDFIEKYKEKKETDSEIIKRFKDDIKKNYENWADAEVAFGEYTKNFENNKEGAEAFLDCHMDFCEKLASHLIEENRKILVKKNIPDYFLYCINTILDNVGNVKKGELFKNRNFNMNSETNYFSFISFNYTKKLDSLVDETVNYLDNTNYIEENSIINPEVIHAHGYTNQTMVLGVNDDSQLKKNIFEKCPYNYKSQVIKPDFHIISQNDYSDEIFDLLEKTDIIYIYGMSLGETDKRWWQKIIEILSTDENKSLFIYYYDNKRKNFFNNRKDPSDEYIMNKFLDYSVIEDKTKSKIKKRIYIERNNIFKSLENIAVIESNKRASALTVNLSGLI